MTTEKASSSYTETLFTLRREIDDCIREKIKLEDEIADIKADVKSILENQAKTKGFIGGVAFVLSGIGFVLGLIVSVFKNSF